MSWEGFGDITLENYREKLSEIGDYERIKVLDKRYGRNLPEEDNMFINCKCITDRERLSLVLSKLPVGCFVRFDSEFTDKYVDVIVWAWRDTSGSRISSFDLQTGEYVNDTFR